MVPRCDLPAVRLYDRLADGKADSDPLMSVGVFRGRLLAFKDKGETIRGYSLSIVPNREYNMICGAPDNQVDGLRTPGMNEGVFQQIDQNLFDQRRIHGNHQEFIRHIYEDMNIRQTFFQGLGHGQRGE